VGARPRRPSWPTLRPGSTEWSGETRATWSGRDSSARDTEGATGLVDGVVVAVAERLGAEAIATLDLRHFGAIAIQGRPRLLPRDLSRLTRGGCLPGSPTR
jgi:hypothetical protein